MTKEQFIHCCERSIPPEYAIATLFGRSVDDLDADELRAAFRWVAWRLRENQRLLARKPVDGTGEACLDRKGER